LSDKLYADFSLKHSSGPYLMVATILLMTMAGTFVVSIRTGQWQLFGASLFGVVVFAPWVLINNRYRISWHDNEITQKATGLPNVSIRVSEITAVTRETSNVSTLVRMRRPQSRIVIHAKHHGGSKSIDVSLKHFVAGDIGKLIRAIREQRPDLAIPKDLVF
jgi:hypothetical protein